MADPTANYCPRGVTDLKMMQDTTNDLSIGSAVKGTSSTSTLYTNFDDLRNNATNSMMDTVYNASKITPTNTEMFRGYPKPTTTMDFQKFTDGTYPSAQVEKAYCNPVLNNIIGFDITITVETEEWPDGDEESQLNYTYTFKFNAGSTTPNLVKRGVTTIYAESGGAEDGYWQINYNNPSGSTYYDFYVADTTADHPKYGDTTWDTSLNYTAPPTVYDYDIDEYENLECSSTVVDTVHVWSYTQISQIVNGKILYSNSGLTTFHPAGNYSSDAGNYFTLNSSGVVGAFYDECET
jgi:hypothetical protein